MKGFLARNADGGSAILVPDDADPTELLEALEGRSSEMARRALEIFRLAMPEASIWTAEEQERFVDQSAARFEAILAVTRAGDQVDESLVDDLRDVGASAAWAGSPLPQLLVVLRISRDLVVQTAVEIAEARGQGSSQALALLLTRVLPALDRLTDALAQGYWAAVICALNLSVVAGSFSACPFLANNGMGFWLSAAMLHAADLRIRQETRPRTPSAVRPA